MKVIKTQAKDRIVVDVMRESPVDRALLRTRRLAVMVLIVGLVVVAGLSSLALMSGTALGATLPCATCIDDPPKLIVGADGTAAGKVTVCNQGAVASKLALTLSDFTALGDNNAPFPLNTTRRLSADSAAERGLVDGTTELDQRCVAVKVDVSGLWQAGMSTATLRNGPEKLADLQAVNLNAPFHIKVDGSNPEKLDLRLVKGQSFDLHLRNEDAMGYRFRWRLDLPGCAVNDVAYVRPNRSVLLQIPRGRCYSDISRLESGFLRSATREGQLVLEYEPDANLEPYALPRRIFKVQAAVSQFDPVWQGVWNTLFVFLLLLIGIAASLSIHYMLPMQRRRVAAKQRLALLEGRLAGLDTLVPARLLALLRVEKKRLREELRQLWPIDPTTEAALPKFEAQMDWLERRIALVASAGDHLSKLNRSTPLAVPEADEVHAACRAVFEVIERQQAVEDDIKVAQAALDQAARLLATATHPPGENMLKALFERAAMVRDRISKGVNPARHEADFDKMVQALLSAVPLQPPAALSVPEYADIALAVAKAQVVADFKLLLAGAQSADVLDRRSARTAELLSALCPGPDESLRRARGIVLEAEQGVSEADLVAALREARPADLRISIDPPRPLPYQRVEMRVHLQQAGFDEADARCRIKCAWNVTGGDIESQDWVANCFFEEKRAPNRIRRLWARLMKRELPQQEEITVAASLYYRGEKLVDVPSVTVKIEPPKSYVVASVSLSLFAMLVTILLAGIGLIAGAQEKIQSLDWGTAVFALLALGFGADVLKRGLSQP
ncbi:hypothetical protein AWB67_01322 [Caballeronia terrestris]|uniref:Uncharacterized protein n=1 Tax=Caballeronia terrestris TaxID=1226301 RepID=A0A158GKD2_9BURK|nr:hypothetical protein [Caballeronia terrestris]SAL32337.1 hypothetical protein AWB67_01322 [Caballeronia terrestris]